MNYNLEPFPEDITLIIQKCEKTIIKIEKSFSNPNCARLGDLYQPDKGQRQKDFLKELGVNCNTKLNAKNVSNNEVQGLYVFAEVLNNNQVNPVYIGISRTVFRRLYQHVWGLNHNAATLAYLQSKTRLNHLEHRQKMEITEIQNDQKEIRNYKIVVIPETNHFDLYFMEVYIAGKLKTKWNSFKTH